MLLNTLVTFLLLTLVAAKSHVVNVGKHGLAFSPGVLHAKKGDKVHFHFYPGFHSVAEGKYGAPCHKKGKLPIWSGFINSNGGPAKKQFTITVKSNKPTWFYCASDSHCQSGMAFGLNPAKKQSLKSYQKRARRVGKTQVPKKVHGGKVGPRG